MGSGFIIGSGEKGLMGSMLKVRGTVGFENKRIGMMG